MIALNVLLTLVMITLLIMEAFIFRPQQLAASSQLKQYVILDLHNVQNQTDSIKPDYLGSELLQNLYVASVSNDVASEEGASEKTNDILKEGLSASLQVFEEGQGQLKSNAKIGIIIANLGRNKRLTELALTLPKEVALGFSPYTSSLRELLYAAQDKGHETYIYLPLEMHDGSGDAHAQHVISSNNSHAENLHRLSLVLASQRDYVGVYTSFKENLIHKQDVAAPILDKLSMHNLHLVMAKKKAVDFVDMQDKVVAADILLDGEADRELILANLQRLVKYAKSHRKAVAYSQGYILTIELLKEWLPSLKAEDIDLVPLSSLAGISE